MKKENTRNQEELVLEDALTQIIFNEKEEQDIVEDDNAEEIDDEDYEVEEDDEDDEEDEEEEESLNPIKKITAPKQIVLKKGKTKTVTVKLRSKNKSMKTTDDVSVTAVSKKVKVSGRKYNSQRLTFQVKGKKKGNTVIYVIIGEKSRKIKVICL